MGRPYSAVAFATREQHAAAYLAHRIRYLPSALDRARRKVAALECEARRYGMRELVE